MIQAGEKAPDFEAQVDTGETVKLSDFKGKRVVLFFYPKDNTPGCTVEACSFRDNAASLETLGATVLGISPDTVRKHVGFKARFDLPYPLIADIGHKIADAYGVWGEKSMYGRKYQGVFRTTFLIGKDGTVERVFEKVSPPTHVAEVEEALRTTR